MMSDDDLLSASAMGFAAALRARVGVAPRAAHSATSAARASEDALDVRAEYQRIQAALRADGDDIQQAATEEQLTTEVPIPEPLLLILTRRPVIAAGHILNIVARVHREQVEQIASLQGQIAALEKRVQGRFENTGPWCGDRTEPGQGTTSKGSIWIPPKYK